MRYVVICVLAFLWGSACAAHMGTGPQAMLAGIIGGGLIGGAVAFTRRHKA